MQVIATKEHGCKIVYYPSFLSAQKSAALYQSLLGLPLEQKHIKLYGKIHAVPRLTYWCGPGGYEYSGIGNEGHEMPVALTETTKLLSGLTGHGFNSALINYYRNGNDSVAMHADDEKELGPEPFIASLSLGVDRLFRIKAKNGTEKHDIILQDGSLLVMGGKTQELYNHGIPKQKNITGGRINVTLRHLVTHG